MRNALSLRVSARTTNRAVVSAGQARSTLPRTLWEDAAVGSKDATVELSPHGTQLDHYPSHHVLGKRVRSARLQALRMGAIKPGIAPGSDTIPPTLAAILWAWAWGSEDSRVTEVARFLVARYEYCYWNRRVFKLPRPKELRMAACE